VIHDTDYNLLSEQFWENLQQEEHHAFPDVLHPLPTKEAVDTVNNAHLAELDSPVLCCKAKHHCVNTKKSKKASAEDAEGLESEVLHRRVTGDDYSKFVDFKRRCQWCSRNC
jgi:hypothetical protein